MTSPCMARFLWILMFHLFWNFQNCFGLRRLCAFYLSLGRAGNLIFNAEKKTMLLGNVSNISYRILIIFFIR